MHPTIQRKTWRENRFIQLAIVLILIFLCYSLSLQRYCTSNHLVAKGGNWSTRQGAKLREYVDSYFKRYHPSQITGFAPIAYGRYTVCLEVYIGPDRQLDNTPATGLEDVHNEIWSMWYFLGSWHKLGANRVDK